jgi:CheY-like chemotaxis protein
MTTPSLPNILLVEDTLTQAIMLKHLLEGKHYKINLAKSGRAAVEYLQTNSADVVLSDVNMPEIDGYMLCSMLKNDAKTAKIPFVIMSSLLQPADIIEILKCGADGFVFKCYDESYFVPALNDVLETLQEKGVSSTPANSKRDERVYDGLRRDIAYDSEKLLGMLLSTFSAAVHQNTVKVKQEA